MRCPQIKDSNIRQLDASNAFNEGLLAQKNPFNGFGNQIWIRWVEAAGGLLTEVEHWGVLVEDP